MRAFSTSLPSKPSFAATVRALGPPLLVALVPKCSACLMAQAALLGWLGIGALPTAVPWPVTAVALVAAVALLAWRARSRRGYGPFALGCAAALLVASELGSAHPATHAHAEMGTHLHLAGWIGTALLVAASVWNAWPVRKHIRSDGNACGSMTC